MKKIRIALAEDNKQLAVAIEEKLQFFAATIDFVFHSIDGTELLKELEKGQGVDVVLMDIEMPGMNGIRATGQVKQKYPQIKVIMLTVFDDEDSIFQAIQAGANGYLLKDETPEKIIDGIKTIMAGGAPMSPLIASKVLHLLRNPEKAIQEADSEDFSLTERESKVLEKLCQGLDYKKIATDLFIAPATVRKHIENIYGKLQVHNKMQAMHKAQKHNLI